MAVYACGDLHGRYDLYEKIKEFLNPEDRVYFLGDANDRGPKGWELIKAIYEDPQFVYIMGNHEDMLLDAMAYFIDSNFKVDAKLRDYLTETESYPTFEKWAAESDKEDWFVKIASLPLYEIYVSEITGKSFCLTHAGFTPGKKSKEEDPLLWDRSHLKDRWPADYENLVVIHGHTPIGLIAPNACEDGIYTGSYWYCNNHKVNLDVGAVWSGFTVLLNLDTLEDFIIG